MKYQEQGKRYTSSNSTLWFHQHALQGYKVPLTHLGKQNYLDIHETENKDLITIKKDIKGFVFDKAPRPNLLADKKNVPAANYYFKPSNQGLQLTKKHQSSFFKKYPRFEAHKENDQKKKIFLFQEQVEEKRHHTFSKAELVGFIDSTIFKAQATPGPGEYNDKMIRHKSLGTFSKGRKNSLVEMAKKQDKNKNRQIGPQTYLIPRSLSLYCSTKLHQPYKQQDEKMKQKIQSMNDKKQKKAKAASKNYLRIEQWCKYSKQKKLIPNRFTVLSKPQLRIYP